MKSTTENFNIISVSFVIANKRRQTIKITVPMTCSGNEYDTEIISNFHCPDAQEYNNLISEILKTVNEMKEK